MARIGVRVAVAVVVLAGAAAVYLYGRVSSFDVERIGDDVHVIRGQGGNVGVLATGRGRRARRHDDLPAAGTAAARAGRAPGGRPTKAIVNTHYHWDHTHGNPAFAPGSRIVATQRTLEYLQALDGGYWQGEAAAMLPNDTFDGRHEMKIGGKTIISHHMGRGHTGGDAVVLFLEDRVLLAGDLLFQGSYPRIDLEGGGSAREWVETLDRVLLLDFDRVVPGHGPVTDRAGLEAFRDYLAGIWREVERAAREGKTLDETLDSVALREEPELEEYWIPFVVRRDRDSVIRSVWQEATGAVQPAAAPSPAPPVAAGKEAS